MKLILHVDRMIELAGRIADGKVTPAAVRRLKRDDAIMVILSLHYSGDLGRIEADPMIDEITKRIYADKNGHKRTKNCRHDAGTIGGR